MSTDIDSEIKQLLIDARARIVWGESAAQVRQSLLAKGLSPENADYVVRLSMKERATEIRAMGTRDVVTGLVLIAISAALIFLFFFLRIDYWRNRFVGGSFGIAVVGLWLVLRGIGKIVGGAKTKGSVPEM